jgi:hypothetical protein
MTATQFIGRRIRGAQPREGGKRDAGGEDGGALQGGTAGDVHKQVFQGLSRAVSNSEQIRAGKSGNIHSAQKLW